MLRVRGLRWPLALPTPAQNYQPQPTDSQLAQTQTWRWLHSVGWDRFSRGILAALAPRVEAAKHLSVAQTPHHPAAQTTV